MAADGADDATAGPATVAVETPSLAAVVESMGLRAGDLDGADVVAVVATTLQAARDADRRSLPLLLDAHDDEARAFLEGSGRLGCAFFDEASLRAALERLDDAGWATPEAPRELSRLDLAEEVSELRGWLARIRSEEVRVQRAREATARHIASLEVLRDELIANLERTEDALRQTTAALEDASVRLERNEAALERTGAALEEARGTIAAMAGTVAWRAHQRLASVTGAVRARLHRILRS